MHGTMELLNQDGTKLKANVVALFNNNDKSYVAYTLEESKDELLVSRYHETQDGVRIEPIVEISEWEFIDKYLETMMFGDENDD